MDIGSIILVILGLCLFEVVSSIDNAVVNADVLSTMSPKGRKWFLVWGIFIGVFLVRGLLPWLIIWGANPSLGPIQALFATFSNNPAILESVEKSAPILLSGGSIFLIFLFLHWLFLEEKDFGFGLEKFFIKNGVWFFTCISIILALTVWFALKINPMMAFGATIGAAAFFVTDGFKEQAAKAELKLKKAQTMSDVGKLVYLEILDATFSIDGVIGAFAFTLSVPLIILGNGLGALVVRQLTIKGVDKIKKYIFLKNGAMYSILFLGIVMLLDSFGHEVPAFVSPLVTFVMVTFFFLKSKKQIQTG
ncbi:MAG: DUF475 domain-containing protein [Candidatus Shapirobacteria bacterium]